MYLDLFVRENEGGCVEPDFCFIYCPECKDFVNCYISASDYGSHVFIDCAGIKIEDHDECGCYGCKDCKCGGIFVVDCLQRSEKDWDDVEELSKVYPPSGMKIDRIGNCKISHSIRVPLLFVEKIVGSEFCNVMAKKDLSEEEIRKVYQDYKNGIDNNDDFYVCDYNLIDDGDIIEETQKTQENIKKMLYVTCNSYNISNPQIPYPENLSLDHDGSAIMFMYNGGQIGYISGD